MLSAPLLGVLRSYWRLARPSLYLFPGRTQDKPIEPTVTFGLAKGATWSGQRRHPPIRERPRAGSFRYGGAIISESGGGIIPLQGGRHRPGIGGRLPQESGGLCEVAGARGRASRKATSHKPD